MSNKNIGILGCGWLGKALATKLIEKKAKVKGTVRRKEELAELDKIKVQPFLISVTPEHIKGDFESFIAHLDALIISLPPSTRKNPDYNFSGSIKLTLDHLDHSSLKKIIFISSTSVFADSPEIPLYDENAKPNSNSNTADQLITAEQSVTNHRIPSTIIRPGGLIGKDRHPITYLAGKKGVSNPDAPVNLVNQEYLVHLIVNSLSSTHIHKVLHAISEPHKSRKDYYTQEAERRGLEKPIFNFEEPSKGKKMSSIHPLKFNR